MLLTELAEALQAHLNSSPEKWNEDGITAGLELDPMSDFINDLKVYITPNFALPVLTPASRGNRTQITEVLYCTLLVGKKFQLPTSGEGVATWAEAKALVSLWQRAQTFLLKYENPDLTLVDIEPSEPEPVQLDLRNYVARTLVGYEQTPCVTAHELVSQSTVSTAGTRLQEIRDSIRSQL